MPHLTDRMAPSARKTARSSDFVPAGNEKVEILPEDFRGLTGEGFKDLPWYRRMHPIHVPLLTVTPVLAVVGLLTADFVWQTYAFALFYFFFTGFGITAGEKSFALVALPAATGWPLPAQSRGSRQVAKPRSRWRGAEFRAGPVAGWKHGQFPRPSAGCHGA